MTEGCFLCKPDPSLVVDLRSNAFAMVGLGPITSKYCVLSARMHVRSLADLCLERPQAIADIENLRDRLRAGGDDLLMTEHGRVPVCRDGGDLHDEHCFHGHALLFAAKTDISGQASSFYSVSAKFADLQSAMEHAALQEHYLLVSPSADRHFVFSGPLNVPRQLSRTLVAIAEGVSHQADWRSDPRHEEARQMAESLRGMGRI